MDVRIKENGYEPIKNSLMSTVLTKDLTNVNDLVDNSGSTENANDAFDSGADSEEASGQEEKEVKAARTVWFQYDDYINMKPEILASKEKAGDCLTNDELYIGYDLDTKSSSSFHVVETMKEFNVNVLVRALILPKDGGEEAVHCDIVAKDTKV